MSQWRGYANGTGGVSIQLPSNTVATLADLPQWRLVECNYTGQIDLEVIVPLLTGFYSFWEKESSKHSEGIFFEACAILLINETSDYLVQFKHPKFSEEAEWRLVSKQSLSYNDLEYRAEVSRLVPYAKIPMKLPSLKVAEGIAGTLRVMCGPNPQPLAARKAIQGYLWKKKVAAVVTSSEVPYR